MSPTKPRPSPDRAAVLTGALMAAARSLSLSQRDVARVLGISEASASRLARGRPIDPDGKEGELALLVLRLFRSLDALVGGNEDNLRKWLRARNAHLGGVPAELIRSVTGLVHVAEYLDAMRGKV